MLTKLVYDALSTKSETELNQNQHNLLNLCRLLVDIHERHTRELDNETPNEYNEGTTSNALQANKYPSLTEACKANGQRGLFV